MPFKARVVIPHRVVSLSFYMVIRKHLMFTKSKEKRTSLCEGQ